MSEGKKHNILFIINDEKGGLKPLLPAICADLVKKGHDVHFIYPPEINEDYEVALRQVPWIHAHKMPIENIFSTSQLTLPIEIRNYIKRHDGISVVHTFGIMPGVLSCIGKIGFKSVIFNTPDAPVNEDGKKQGVSLFQRFFMDNILFLFNRLYGKVIFASEKDKDKYMEHISYKNLNVDFVDVNGNIEQLTDKLVEIYSVTIESNKK